MFSDGGLPNEEIAKAELKSKIAEIFDKVELKDEDPKLNQEILHQKRIAINITRAAETDESLKEEAREAKSRFGQLLEEATDRHLESDKVRIGAGILNAKFFYEIGNTAAAIEILDGSEEDNYETGYLEYTRNLATTSEEYENLYYEIKDLIRLLVDFERLNAQT